MNKIQVEKFKVVPDAKIYGALGHTGMSFREAISELIDNCIDARVPDNKLSIEIELDEENGCIRIRDNGKGMTKEEAKNAIILGSSSKKDKLGLFGLGLKTAGLSLGNVITIITKNGSDQKYQIEFDRTDFEKKSDWELNVKTVIDEEWQSGTLIVIADLREAISYSKADRLHTYFADRYGTFIKSGDVEISINNTLCEPAAPEYILEQNISLKTKRGDMIKGFLRVQTKRSIKSQEYGFDLYKNGRLIRSNDKIGLGGEHPEKALIRGEFDLSFAEVNFTKNDFMREREKFKAAENEIKNFIKPLIPLFSTKNLNKEKIAKLMQIQKKSNKILNLNDFKELLVKVTEMEETEDEEAGTEESGDKTGSEETEDGDNGIKGIPTQTSFLTLIDQHSSFLGQISAAMNDIRSDSEAISKLSDDSWSKTKLEEYSESLYNAAKETKDFLKNL